MSTHIVNLILVHRVVPYEIPDLLLSGNGSESVTKFLAALCRILGAKHPTTTAYNSRTNGEVKRYKKAIVASLQFYVAKHRNSGYIKAVADVCE